MPNKKAAIKALRQDTRKAIRNASKKSLIKSTLRKSREVIQNNGDVDQILKSAFATIDKACSKGVLKKETASRKKSRLATTAYKATAST